jgi:YHS domain-containing protein
MVPVSNNTNWRIFVNGFISRAFALSLALICPAVVAAQEAAPSPSPEVAASAAAPDGEPGTIFKDAEGIAIQGYDTVAFFTDSKPVKGDPAIVHEWAGAKWYFASEDHKKLFAEDPKKYAPQFGGHCAWGVSKGGLYKTECDAWKVVDGKLYLNYNLDAQKEWEKEQAMHIERAHQNYDSIKNGKTEE